VFFCAERGGGRGGGCGVLLSDGWWIGRDVGSYFIVFVGFVKNGGCIVIDALLKYCSDSGGCSFRECSGGARQ